MRLPLFIAKRYFSAKKSPLVTVIGRVAVIGIAVSTAAMMLILSVMNGMSRFVAERFGAMDADLKVEVVKGKYFEDDTLLQGIRRIPGVAAASGVLQDQALLSYGGQNVMVVLKGVDSVFEQVSDIRKYVYSGDYNIDYNNDAAFTVMGNGVFGMLEIPSRQVEPCLLYTVNGSLLNSPFAMQQAVQSAAVYPSGIFSVIPDYDNSLLICHIDYVRKMFQPGNTLSAIELRVRPEYGITEVKRQIQSLVGNGFTVKDKAEQQQTIFKSMKAEKLIVVVVFFFVLLISTFTMVANQMLLMYEKRRDIAILSAMGMERGKLKTLFLSNGLLVCLWGTFWGLLAGTLLAFGQQRFGWVKLGGGSGNYITDAYPVYWMPSDLLVVLCVGLFIGLLASALPLRQVGVFAQKPTGKE